MRLVFFFFEKNKHIKNIFVAFSSICVKIKKNKVTSRIGAVHYIKCSSTIILFEKACQCNALANQLSAIATKIFIIFRKYR